MKRALLYLALPYFALPGFAFAQPANMTQQPGPVASAPAPALAPDIYVAPLAGFAYSDFGTPAAVVARHSDPATGSVTVTYDTGARLVVRPDPTSEGPVAVEVAIGSGRSGVPASLVHALWSSILMPLGGTQRISYADLDSWQQQSGTSVNVQLIPDISAWRLSATTTPSDLITEVALLAAYARDGAYGGNLGPRIASMAPVIAAQIEASPFKVYARVVQHALFGATSRYSDLPDATDLDATRGDELAPMLKEPLGEAPDIAIAGNIDVDKAINTVATTLAAGDIRKRTAFAPAVIEPQQSASHVWRSFHNGNPSQAWTGLYWPIDAGHAGAPVNVDRAALQVLALVLDGRLKHTLGKPAEADGEAFAVALSSVEFDRAGWLGLGAPWAANALAAGRQTLATLVADIVRHPPTSDELAAARTALSASFEAARRDNAWWAHNLALRLHSDGAIPLPVGAADLSALTDEDLRDFAARHCVGRAAFVIEAIPARARPGAASGVAP